MKDFLMKGTGNGDADESVSKKIPNGITMLRILAAPCLLFAKRFSVLFWFVYALCGISDWLDGSLARKLGTESKFGQILDSVADFEFIGIVLWRLLPEITQEGWILGAVCVIAAVRLLTILCGFVRYGQLAVFHTYANKAAGFALFCAPILFEVLGFGPAALSVCVIAGVASIEELLICLHGGVLQRDTKSLIKLGKKGSNG